MKIGLINSFEVFKSKQNKKGGNVQQSQQIANTPAKINLINALDILSANAIVGIKSTQEKKQPDPIIKQVQELHNFYQKASKPIEPLIASVEKRKNDTAKRAQDLLDDVLRVYEEYKNNSNNPRVRIVQDSEGFTLMEELDENGKVKRETTFYPNCGDILIKENFEKLPDGSEKIEKELYAAREGNSYELAFYSEDVSRYLDGKVNMGKRLNFLFDSYQENDGIFPKDTPKIGVFYESRNGQPVLYEEFDIQNQLTRKRISFLDGKVGEYKETKRKAPNKPIVEKTAYFVDTFMYPNLKEGEAAVCVRYEDIPKSQTEYVRELFLENGEPAKYKESRECGYHSKTIKEYHMTENGWEKLPAKR